MHFHSGEMRKGNENEIWAQEPVQKKIA